jgi:hypothetical protein
MVENLFEIKNFIYCDDTFFMLGKFATSTKFVSVLNCAYETETFEYANVSFTFLFPEIALKEATSVKLLIHYV